jgi:hypothetical protein
MLPQSLAPGSQSVGNIKDHQKLQSTQDLQCRSALRATFASIVLKKFIGLN